MPFCHSCKKPFADFKELALHIISSKKGHRHGKRWAAKYLLKVRQLDKRKELNGRTPMTEEQKENKRNLERELSGENEFVITYCPHCKSLKKQPMPIEFTQSGEAWREKDKLVVLCPSCL